MEKPRVIILMGVAGSGKSTVGRVLASEHGGTFYDADDFHPAANIAKMAAGIPLDDSDRAPWLARLREEVIDAAPAGGLVVLACSALKKRYREQLGVGSNGVALIYLTGTPEILAERLAGRTGHYMKSGMLESQLGTLEEPSPEEALWVDTGPGVDDIVASIERGLGLKA